jgi:cell division protein FtsB
MPSRSDIEPISKQLTIVVGLTVVGFMAFGLAVSFYRNILFEETLAELEKGNDLIATEIDALYRDLEYVRSDLFKDRFAKQNLGKINPGEQLLIITEPPPLLPGSPLDDPKQEERREAAYAELLRQMPILEHWKLYLFHRDRIPKIREAL